MRQAGISGLVSSASAAARRSACPASGSPTTSSSASFRPGGAERAWVADITYLRTWEGWLYLAAVQDAYSRRIVGWSMADHMRAELVVDALQMAIARRRPAPGLIHHTDHGSQYVSLGFGQAAGDAGIARSMGSRGDATTTPSPRASSRPSRRSSSTATPGRPAASSRARSSTTSKPSTTPVGDTPPSGCSPRPNSRRKPSLTTTPTDLGPQAPDCPPKRGKSTACRLHRLETREVRLASSVALALAGALDPAQQTGLGPASNRSRSVVGQVKATKEMSVEPGVRDITATTPPLLVERLVKTRTTALGNRRRKPLVIVEVEVVQVSRHFFIASRQRIRRCDLHAPANTRIVSVTDQLEHKLRADPRDARPSQPLCVLAQDRLS